MFYLSDERLNEIANKYQYEKKYPINAVFYPTFKKYYDEYCWRDNIAKARVMKRIKRRIKK